MASLSYDELGAGYDELYEDEQYAKYRYALQLLGLQELQVILDAGCGTGLLLKHLRAHGHSYRDYVGLDLSSGTLAVAKQRSGASDHIIQADIHFLPFRRRAFDHTFAFTVLHHLDPQPSMKEMARVTRKALIVTAHKQLPHQVDWPNAYDEPTVKDKVYVFHFHG